MTQFTIVDTETLQNFPLSAAASASLTTLMSDPVISSAAAKFFGLSYAEIEKRIQFSEAVAHKVAVEMLDQKLYDVDSINVSMNYK